ncbi:heme ABC exporter ATP-binding protein CcmA [Ideonella azotifigens]|nr:heme ABC exporter ATP-binding protein CcmA [Ideonella azotifigens]MCD2340450.1 heme ABC exporter ATP-binding protein CcmA [Ideonella azotifigens]
MPPPRLVLRGMVGVRQGRRLWGPLTLALSAGSALHLQGPNGSGKTTLLRTLAGLRAPAAGHCERDGEAWFIGHALPLADELDALANLRGWLGLSARVDDAVLQAWLDQMQVPRQRPLRQLSAGQRRRLALAPLALQPRPLWLLDEPFDALDAAGQSALCALAQSHLASGGALVLSAHQGLPAGFPACEALRLGPADWVGTVGQ